MAELQSRRKRAESRPASSPLAASMGRAIQVVRTDRGQSRKDLAERTGLSYSFLAEIENGVKTPSNRTFATIATALDVATGALLYDAERRLVEFGAASDAEALALRGRVDFETSAESESGLRAERSRRVLDWLSGPLARRSSGGDSAVARIPPRHAVEIDRTDRLALVVPESAQMAPGSVDSDRGTACATQFLDSLLPLLGELSAEDRELVLDLARRLSQRNRTSLPDA